MKFNILDRTAFLPKIGTDTVYLKTDRWNDFSFVTMFHMSLHDEAGQLHDIGIVKIGFKGQTTEISTFSKLPAIFERIGDEFFSLGQSIEFYRNMASLPERLRKQILGALHDIVEQPNLIEDIRSEEVFSKSLLRDISLSVIRGQFARVLEGKTALTDFKFKFSRLESDHLGGLDISFDVEVGSIPSTNIHAIIGRNGVGKTTLLNGMIETITNRDNVSSKFISTEGFTESEISKDYFSSLVSISFSAFDPFNPPKEQPDPAKGTCYFYIGLKDAYNGEKHRTISDLRDDCVRALISCFYKSDKTERWLSAISKLGSDENFASMGMEQLEAIYRATLQDNVIGEEQPGSSTFREKYREKIAPLLNKMSSGHAIVLLIITRLVATVEEKTLVLFDEPESHLHPPLLSALLRALADLLNDRNGVAVITTHSPVVLQEIPRSCVWKIYRVGTSVATSRPAIETFAENVGVLTSEVFSLEVERSGFHDLLVKAVQAGKTYEAIVSDYNDKLGFEGRAILKALTADRDRRSSHDSTE